MTCDPRFVTRVARALEQSSATRLRSQLCFCRKARLAAQINVLERRRFSQSHLRRVEQRNSRTDTPPPPVPPAPTAKQLAEAVRQASQPGLLGGVLTPYSTFTSSEQLFKRFLTQANYTIPNALKKPAEPAPKNDAGEDIGVGTGVWFASRDQGGIGLPVTFGNWAQIMMLHMYIVMVRMRAYTNKGELRSWEQQLLDHFTHAAEEKMEKFHGMVARGVRNKHLKDLWLSYRGVILSYDEGLARGDAALAAAVWRAIFKGADDADIADIATLVAYIRREVQKLETVTHQEVMFGHYKFGDLASLKQDQKGTKSRNTPKSLADTAPQVPDSLPASM